MKQIVLSIPLLAPSQSALLTDGEEVTEVDRVLFDTEPGAENLVQIEEDESTAVMVTKLRLGEHGDQEATPEEVELAKLSCQILVTRPEELCSPTKKKAETRRRRSFS